MRVILIYLSYLIYFGTRDVPLAVSVAGYQATMRVDVDVDAALALLRGSPKADQDGWTPLHFDASSFPTLV